MTSPSLRHYPDDQRINQNSITGNQQHLRKRAHKARVSPTPIKCRVISMMSEEIHHPAEMKLPLDYHRTAVSLSNFQQLRQHNTGAPTISKRSQWPRNILARDKGHRTYLAMCFNWLRLTVENFVGLRSYRAFPVEECVAGFL